MKVPYTTFKTRVGDNETLGGGCAIGGEWRDVTTEDLFTDKKIIVFSLPGAYTPTCSSQQVPQYEEKYDELKKYVDEVYCISVNDAFVMNAWARDQKIEKVKMIPDGAGAFTRGMDMLVNKPKQGFGMRSWRYSMLINNGEVVKQFVEEGKNNASDDNDPFEVSGVETMLKYLQENND